MYISSLQLSTWVSDLPFLLRCLKIWSNILKCHIQNEPSIKSTTIYPSPRKPKKIIGLLRDYFFSLTYHSIHQVLSDLKYSSDPMTYYLAARLYVVLATIIAAWTTEVISTSSPYFCSCLPQSIFHLAATRIMKKKKKERERKSIYQYNMIIELI